jgi:hypothetical protein
MRVPALHQVLGGAVEDQADLLFVVAFAHAHAACAFGDGQISRVLTWRIFPRTGAPGFQVPAIRPPARRA